MAAVPAERQQEQLEAWRDAHELEDRPRHVRPAKALLRALNARVDELGGSVSAVKARIRGDMALGRQEFGESTLVHWN